MAKKISQNEIRNINEDWAYDDRNGYPYSGLSVLDFIKQSLNSKGGEFYYDSDTTKYLIFANAENREIYLANREENEDLVIGRFDAPANYVASINVSTPTSNVVLSGSKGNYIDFTFDVKTREGQSTGEAVVATYTFNNSGNVKKITQIYNYGTNVHFLIDSYLNDGVNSINIVITGRSNSVSTMTAVNFVVVALKLDSNFNFSNSITKGLNLGIPYHLEGAGVKYIEWYIDGVLQSDNIDTISDLRIDRTKNFNTGDMSVGKHNVLFRAYVTNNGENFYSNTLYFNFVISDANVVSQQSITYVLLGLNLSYPVQDTLNVSATLYEEFKYKAAVYDNRQRSLVMTVYDNGSPVQNITMHYDEVQSLKYIPTTTGLHILTFNAEEDSETLNVNVQTGEIDIKETTDELVLKLTAKGRNNNETNPGTWSYRNITTTFSDGFTWSELSGWNGEALVIPKGESININYSPLSTSSTVYGKTIEIDFETINIEDDNATILNITNSDTNAGLKLTASTAELRSREGARIYTKYRDGDRINLSFIINKTDGDDARMMYIVNNGILERAERFSPSDIFNAPGSMTIGSNGCGVKIYSIRVYNRAISVDEAFCNYAVDSPDLINIASNNDIFDSNSVGTINVDKVSAHIPVMIITGNIDYILGISTKENKNDWNTYPVQIEFRDVLNPERNFFIDDADIRLQGTSSISYPRKNFRIYSKSKSKKYNTKLYSPTHSSQDLIESGKYSFKPNSAPVSCWCLKADYAESSGSHNVGIAKLWNRLMYNSLDKSNNTHPLRTLAQNWALENHYPYDVRTTIDGFPIVLFQRNDENSALTCLGLYNFNNDKSTEDVFGFTELSVTDEDGNTETFDNTNVLCWEVLDSDSSIALFTDVSNFDSNWDSAFEARYPGDSKNVTKLKIVSEWINSCYLGMDGEDLIQVDLAQWKAGKADHFDLPKLAAYYIYLLRFGAVDQTVKNAMFTTEDGVHWFYINYDNDTVMGIDNASHLFDTWDYGLKTKTPSGGYYYAGSKSVLWKCFEEDEECMNLAYEIDKILYDAGMNYTSICDMFDNEQSGKWCERIYNINGRYKYIDQAFIGNNYLHMLQGSRTSHRHWWLLHRLEKYDNAFGNGTYSARSIKVRAYGSETVIPAGTTYSFVPAITSYYGYNVGSTIVDRPTERNAGTEYVSTGLPQLTSVGNLIEIYNANNIQELNLNGYKLALGTVDLSAAVDVNGSSKLRRLILGNREDFVNNNYLTSINGLSLHKELEELNIEYYTQIRNIDALAELPNLHKLYAEGSGLTSFTPANGSRLIDVDLPSCILSINLTNNIVDILNFTIQKTLLSVLLRNVSGRWQTSGAVKDFINNWLELFTDQELTELTLTLTGIDWDDMTVQEVIRMGKVGTKILQGKVTLNSLNLEEYNLIVEVFGANVFEPNGTFVIDAPANMFISGPTQITAGHTGKYTSIAFPVTENEIQYLMYNGSTLIEAQTDLQGKVYRTYGGITLYEETGNVSVDIGINSDVIVGIRAKVKNTFTYSEVITLTGKALTYPLALNILGPDTLSTIGTLGYDYTKSFTSEFTASIISVAWSLSNETYTSIDSQSSEGATLNFRTLPTESTDVTLTCIVTFEGDRVVTGTKTISQAIVPITSFNILGQNSILSNGFYDYTISGIQPSEYNIGISSISASVSPSLQYVSVTETRIDGVTLIVENIPDPGVAITLSIDATLSNGNVITVNKRIEIGLVLEIEAVYQGNGDTSVNLYKSLYNMSSMTVDGESKTISPNYTFGDTDDHTVVFTFSNLSTLSSSCFNGCDRLKNIILSDNITSIGNYAFRTCTMLESITLPNNLKSIGLETFYGCHNLTSVHFGTKFESIGKTSFGCCDKLENITVENGNTTFDSRDNCNALILTSTNTLICGCGSTTIPNTVTSIGPGAFELMTGIERITIPSSVTSIGTSAFNDCNNLKKITILSNSTVVGANVWHYCDNITSIGPIGSNCDFLYSWSTLIPDNAFSGLSRVTRVTIPNTVTSIGEMSFVNTQNLQNITIPNSVTTIKTRAFLGSGLRSITIPSTVTNIGTSICQQCNYLSTITVENGNTTFDSRDNCNAIIETSTGKLIQGCNTTTIVPSGVTSIGEYAFYYCTNLSSITLPNGLISIDNYAFGNCMFTDITIPNTVTSIGSNAFRYSYIRTVTGAESLESIGDNAFDHSSLTTMSFGNNLEEIGEAAFTYCYGLNNVVLPDTTTTIGASAFGQCTSLTSVTLGTGLTTIGNYAFTNCAFTSITIPNNITSIGDNTFQNCTKLASITIPNSVTSIGNYALSGCSNLASITINRLQPPNLGTSCFGNDVTNYTGKDVQGTKTLYVPTGSTGYNTWTTLLNTCNFTLSATL